MTRMKSATAIYARVSTDDQADKQTIQTQILACRAWCKAQGYAVSAEFTDAGVSGTVPFAERPAGQQLLADLEAGLFDRVILYCVDRLSRDNETGVPAYNLLHRKTKGQVHFVVQTFDDTPEGKLQFHLFLAIAEYERGVIARRTTQGQHRLLAQGIKSRGRNPLGYHWNPDAKKFEAKAGEAEIVRLVFQKYAAGESLRTIAVHLSDQGLASPDALRGHKAGAARWQPATIHRILMRDYYASGMMRGEFMGEPYSLAVPPIVDVELFQRVQVRLRESRHFPRRLSTQGLFQGIIRCGSCGRRYHRGSFGAKQASIYFCPGRLSQTQRVEGTPKCPSPNLKLVPTDTELWRALVLSIQNPQRLAHEFLDHLEAEISAAQVGLSVRTELEEWEEKRAAATKLLTRPGMSVKAVMDTITELDDRIDRCERQLQGKEDDLRQLKELEEQKDELEQAINGDQRVIMDIGARIAGDPVDVDDDEALGRWLRTPRAIGVRVGKEAEGIAAFDLATADKLLDALDVAVTVIPNPLGEKGVDPGSPGYPLLPTPGDVSPWRIQVTGNSLWFTTSHSALSRSPGRTSRLLRG